MKLLRPTILTATTSRRRLGLRWQSGATTPLSFARSVLEFSGRSGDAKGPSSQRSAGAVQNRRGLRAFTIVELVISAAILVLVLGALGMLTVQMGVELKGGMSEASLQIEADLLQDKMLALLRPMSATKAVIPGDFVPGSNSQLFRRIIIARGDPPDYKQEEIYFNTNSFILTHDPDRGTSADEKALFTPRDSAVLRQLYFFLGEKGDGSPDDATLNVVMQLDNSRTATYRNAAGKRITNSLSRYFTVRMRAD